MRGKKICKNRCLVHWREKKDLENEEEMDLQ